MSDFNFETENNNSPNVLQTILRDYLPYWPVVLVMAILGYFASGIYLRYARPIYNFAATVVIKNEDKSADNLIKQSILGEGTSSVEDEVAIMKGRNVIGRAIDIANAFYEVITYGKINYSIVNSDDLPFELIFLNRDSINPTTKKIQFDPITHEVVIDNLVKCGWGKVISIDNNKVIFKEKSVKNVSWKNAFLGAKEIKLIFKSKAQMVSNVLQNFTAETNKKNALVELQYQTEIERGGESVLDAIIDAYIIESQEEKRKMSEFTMDFIDSRLAYLGQDLDSVERELEVFKSNNDIQAVSTTANRVLSKVQEGDVKMVELDLQLMVLDDLEKYVLGKFTVAEMKIIKKTITTAALFLF
jgi:uncharacterized protein involved in exopolysaccharide biosynthesis